MKTQGGYSHENGMSNRALDAYDRGVKPLSKISVPDLTRAGWKHTLVFAKFLAKKGVWPSSEWHHSGGEYCNRVDFFDPDDLVAEWDGMDQAEKENWLAIREKEVQNRCLKNRADDKCERVIGQYTIWGGSKRQPRRIGTQKFSGMLRGDWIILDDGGRKKASGNHINWRRLP